MLSSLKTKLSLSYILIILICVAIISISSNIMLEKQFENYVMKQQEKKVDNIVSLINQRYNTIGNWDIDYIEDVGLNALENGMIISVHDANDNLIWDATIHNDGLCQDMLLSMSQNMQSRFSETEGGYEEKVFDLTNGYKKTGSVFIGYYGPFYYTDSDLNFINTINSLLIWAGAISLILALGLGVLMSNQLSKPISRVIFKAQKITHGLYDEKISEKSKTKEIRLLVDTINNLADTLKKQQDTSRQTSLDLAHELRTPLTTIQGNLEAMIDGVMELDEHRLEILYDEILRINRLVDDLGKLARYENTSLVLNKTKFNLSQLIKNSIKSFESDLKKDNKKIIFYGDSLDIYADKDKIKQIICNLISNSLKYTGVDGEIEITVKSVDDKIKMIIKDNGIGISQEDLPYIFDRFYRSDKSRNRHTGGAGIGLTIVKSIVAAHEGDVKVSSILGSGSEFVIYLPNTKTLI